MVAAEPIRLVTFVVGGQRCALPLASVSRVLPMVAITALPGGPAVTLGVINVGGRILPVLDPRQRLGCAAVAYGLEARLVVVRTARRTLALAVDDVLGVTEVPRHDVVAAAGVLPGATPTNAVARLPDGVLLVHDPDAFLGLDEERQLDDAMPESGP